MNRLQLFALLLLTLLGLLLSGQQPGVNTAHAPAELDSLLAHHEIPQALELLNDSMKMEVKAGNWKQYCVHVRKYLDLLHNRKQYAEIDTKVQEAIDKLQEAKWGDSTICAGLWGWKGFNCRNMDEFAQALDAYRKAIHLYEARHTNSPDVSFAYKNAAQILLRYSDNKGAINYLEAALRCDNSQKNALSIYSQLTFAYFSMNNLPAARRQYESGLKLLPNSTNNNYKASFFSNGALLAVRDGKLDMAKELDEKALEMHLVTNDDDGCLRDYTNLADVALQNNKPDDAAHYYQLAESYAQKNYNRKSREVGKMDIEIGQFHEKQGSLSTALAYFQKALIQTFPDFNSLDPNDNPPITAAWLEAQALSAASAKANVLLRMAEKAPNAVALRNNAAQCFDLSFAIAAKLRHTYGNDVDKLAQSASLRPDYALAAKNLWQVWLQSNDKAHLEHLFSLVEQTKAQALSDALQQQRALALAGIPDTLLAREAALRRAVADYTEALTDAQSRNDSTAAQRDQVQLLLANRAEDSLLTEFQNRFPVFRQFSDAELPADYPAVRAAIPDTTALVSWFDAGDRYFWIAVRRDGIQAGELPRDAAFDQELSGFINLLSDQNSQQSNPAGFLQQNAAISQKILSGNWFQGIKSLIIAPDGSLNFLPFEVLLTGENPGASYAQAPYLLRQCAVAYTWSAKMLTAPADPLVRHEFIQFAPFVSTGRGPFPALTSSLADVPDDIPHDLIQDKKATAGRFLDKARNCGILHLSTHAEAAVTLAPGIEFYDRTLLLPEIYAQRLHTSLVSLSACETGTGALANGEGVLSLARAFAYAGAQSLVASLWQVNDRAAANLFSSFYTNLSKGQSKSAAIRNAKLAALSAAAPEASKAPFFWAALTLNGADGQVIFPEKSVWGWWLYVLLAGVLVFALSRFRKKASS